jgi:hypothetical protein
MRQRITCLIRHSILIFLVWPFAEAVHSQIIPPDTTTYWLTNWTGIKTPMRRPPDSLMVKGTVILRFHANQLDTGKLLDRYYGWYRGYDTYHKGEKKAQSGPLGGGSDGQRGFPTVLRTELMNDQFYLDSSSNIVCDPALVAFLEAAGGKYLTRLTTASPYDTLSITRNNDTVTCDHYLWMVLHTDSVQNPLLISYALLKLYGRDIKFATPDYRGATYLGTRHPNDLWYGCQKGQHTMIDAETAWWDEVGHDSTRVAIFDDAVDWRAPDLGGAMGKGKHVVWGWNFSNDHDSVVHEAWKVQSAHGTEIAGIIGALTNRNSQTVAGIAGGWGNLPGATDTIDRGYGASLIILAAGDYEDNDIGNNFTLGTFLDAIFEASAHSTVTMYGLAAHVINVATQFGGDNEPATQAAISYTFENGVVFVAANGQGAGLNRQDFPAGWDEPWIVSVGGSVPTPALDTPSRTPASDYGYTMDMLAPSGGDPLPCVDPYTLNFTTYPGDSLGHDTSFHYGSFAGNSAASPNVSGSAALLLSYYYRLDSIYLKHVEPEDIQNMLKASCWRGDPDRASIGWTNCYRATSGWGHLNIGNTFKLLDSGYEIKHFSLTGNSKLDKLNNPHLLSETFDTGSWQDIPDDSAFQGGYRFYVPYEVNEAGGPGKLTKYKQRSYLLDDSVTSIYHGQYRVDTAIVTIDTLWVVDSTKNENLFAWGRSGGMNEKSGWSFNNTNEQTGWSRVINGTGGDSLNESIFHSQSRTFKIITVQYNLWRAKNPGTDPFDSVGKIVFGNVPPDTMIGLNFSVFGKVKPQYSSVPERPRAIAPKLYLSIDNAQTVLTIHNASGQLLRNVSIQLYDLLGREIGTRQLRSQETLSIPMSILMLPTGTYFCRISTTDFVQSKKFSIVR